MFDSDPLSAIDAIAAAQRLAFAPLAFHAASVMRDRGVLAALAKAGADGLAIDEVAATTGLSPYAARVLLEAGLGMRIVWRRGDRFHLGKVGHFLLNDEMTRVNFDFSRDVCYAAAARTWTRPCRRALRAACSRSARGQRSTRASRCCPSRRGAAGSRSIISIPTRRFPRPAIGSPRAPPARLLDVGCNYRQVGADVPRAPSADRRSGWPTCRSSSTPRARTCTRPGCSNAHAGIRSICSTPMRRCRAATT